MAGDWIKVEHATLDKPEVSYLAELLGVKHDEALGILLRFWVWLDRNARNGSVTHVTLRSLDATMNCPGFASAIVVVGWAQMDEKTRELHVPNFARHNENPAKTRSSNAERQARYRENKRNENVTLRRYESVTREEKRREEVKPKTPSPEAPAGVSQETWADWVKHKGRKLTPAAYRQQCKFLAKQRDPDACVAQSIRNGWAGLFPVDGVKALSLAEKRSDNIAFITGRKTDERVIDAFAERVGGEAIRTLPGALRQSNGDDVG